MNYTMTFILEEEKALTLHMIENYLKNEADEYEISVPDEKEEKGNLLFEKNLFASMVIRRKGDLLLEDEIKKMMLEAKSSDGKNKGIVLQSLKNAIAIVSVEVFFDNREIAETLEKIDPVWEFLLESYMGLLYVEGEGFYDADDLLIDLSE